MGIPVLGSGRQASSVVQQLNRRRPTVGEIIIAMPSATGPQMRETLANCRAAHIPCKTIPSIDELLRAKVLTAQVRSGSVQDLLGQAAHKHLDEASGESAHRWPLHPPRSPAPRAQVGSELCRRGGGALRAGAPGGIRSGGERPLQDRE